MGDGAVTGRGLVFVSYSHADQACLDRLLVLLTPVVRNRRLRVWADPYVPAGADRRREIDGAIDRADLAVLLVSGDFLASSFIMDVELPALVARGVPLVPVLAGACLWRYEPLLARVQWAHDPGRDGPLGEAGDRDGRLVRICQRVIDVLAAHDATGAEPVTPVAAEPVTVQRLVSSPRPGRVDGVPPLPPGYVARADLSRLRAAVLETDTGVVGLTGNTAALGLHGQGGVGSRCWQQRSQPTSRSAGSSRTACSG